MYMNISFLSITYSLNGKKKHIWFTDNLLHGMKSDYLFKCQSALATLLARHLLCTRHSWLLIYNTKFLNWKAAVSKVGIDSSLTNYLACHSLL